MLLKIEDLNIFRDHVHACMDVSFEVKKGEIIGIGGPNGAGKTSLLQGLMSLIPVRSGHVFFNNMEITNLPPYKIARLGIGYVPEDRRLFDELTVKENILLPCWGKKVMLREEDLEILVEEVFPEVKKLYNKRSIHCSGGEQMMVAILRTLSSKPSLLLLDECFEGLAPIARRRLREYLIKEKERSGISVVLTESNINFLTWVDKLFYIERGCLQPFKKET